MVVTRRKSASSPAATTESSQPEPQTEKIDVQKTIDKLEYDLMGKLKDSMAIPDTMLTPELQNALGDIAKKYFSIDDYAPDKFSSLYAAVNKSEQVKLYPPSFKAWGEGVVLVWSNEIYHLPSDTPCDSISGLKLTKRDSGPVIVIDKKGYNAEFRVALKTEYLRGENAVDNWFSEHGEVIQTIGELSEFLQRGEKLVKWADIEPGSEIQILEIEPVFDRETGTEIAFWYGYTEIDGHPCKIYMPGEKDSWVNYDLEDDLIFTKVDETTVTDNKGNEFELGLSFKKMAELVIDKTYIIWEIKESTGGSFGTGYSLLVSLDGETTPQTFWVNANTFIKERIKKGIFTPSRENLGYLKVTSHSKAKNGKTIVNCTITTQKDRESENSMAKAIEAAAKKAAKTKTKVGDIPF